ncbi:penicillin-binding transpeptidase domain-containing protein [Feifania hominis]|uniref:PASTA domain-containing protein n=1 Tax=Feifania hominis TaxID=2763660 RepID=A0A926DD86_9FIRM|nr:penicillin-binding transpeptidase domain-containing protein [Feifania hominis]MBC8535184.1 PASTA domain-containing protein [Feifania hominis]
MNKGLSKKIVQRMLLIVVCFAVLGLIPIVAKLFHIQIIQNEFYQKKAIDQQTRDTEISPKRGTIYDRNMKKLAVSASVETVLLNPKAVKDDEQANLIADGMAEILGVDREKVYKQTQANNYYEIIKKKVEKETADQVRTFLSENKIKCITLAEDSKRYYPYGNFASHILGFTDTDGRGLEGVEAYYNDILEGTPGRVITAKNAKNTDMPFKYEKYIDAQNGANLVLTIDEVMQHFLEKHLATAVADYKVQNKACGIIMDIHSGEILAMATMPDYDPNNPREITDEALKAELEALEGEEYTKRQSEIWQGIWRNKAISDNYEPGSAFKLITSAMALEEGTQSEQDTFYCPGYHKVGGRTIRCWKRAGHGAETFEKGLQNSCNPVFMLVGEKLGAETFQKYIKAFGLREKTGIDLYGEESGVWFRDSDFGIVSLAVASFGQTFKITPIQMVTAVAAIGNGGNLVVPHVAKEIVDDDGNVLDTFPTEVRRQVISEETSQRVISMAEKVVSIGTGKNARVTGYQIAGKTATSEKIDQKNEEGIVDKRIASFVAIAPADDPQIVVFVMLDEPDMPTNMQGGGAIAAPTVSKILADVLPYMNIAPQYTEEELAKLEVKVPNVTGLTVAEAKTAVTDIGCTVSVNGSGETVISQMPKEGQKLTKGGRVILYTEETDVKLVEVPNLVGKSMPAARKALSGVGLNISAQGKDSDSAEATVTKQYVEAGTMVEAGSIVAVDYKFDTGTE